MFLVNRAVSQSAQTAGLTRDVNSFGAKIPPSDSRFGLTFLWLFLRFSSRRIGRVADCPSQLLIAVTT